MAETYEEALLRLETALFSTTAVSGWIKSLDDLAALGDDPAAIRAALSKIKSPKMRTAILAALGESVRAGMLSATRTILPALDGDNVAARALYNRALGSFRFSAGLLESGAALDEAGREAIRQAKLVQSTGGSSQAILAPLKAHRQATTRATTRAVNQGANEGIAHAATEGGLPVVWVAERNACVRCLRYSGEISRDGVPFPGGLTYGNRKPGGGPLKTPGLHPYCRCHLEPLRDQTYADSLRREADRSVLRGYSLESEPTSVRVDAAKKLIADGVTAPKSVIAFSKRSIKDGKFPQPRREPGRPAHDFTP